MVLLVFGLTRLYVQLWMESFHHTHTQEPQDFIFFIILVTLGMTLSQILIYSFTPLICSFCCVPIKNVVQIPSNNLCTNLRGVWLVIFKCLIITRYFLLIFLLFSITTVGWKVLLVNK